ncbi:MAG TPA: LPS export ABC transporter periplasmic protein LptC [Burkholderiales bacterium]|nr:LPS export ABC transporter periplasmic protein LptC [Burkholderiales bacterium]
MKTRVAPLLPLALMAFLGLLTLWLQYAVRQDAGGDTRYRTHEPDAIVDNFTVQDLDASGKLRYTFSAPKMQHFADDGSGEALYPRVVQVAADGGGNYVATANRGTIKREGEEAFLYGNVLILREATPEEPELQARTEFLHVLAGQGILRTNQTVTITDGRSTLTGVGLVINKAKQQFTLQSQVRGTFDAPRKR